MSQSAVYSEIQARLANVTLTDLGIPSWDLSDVQSLQQRIGVTPADGWLGPQSIAAWKTWKRTTKPNTVSQDHNPVTPGCVIIGGKGYTPPVGIKIVNYLEPNGIPAQLEDTSERKWPVYQFVLHRGAESIRKGENYAQATERILDTRGLSTTFSMDIDGTIYQHFDPAVRRGRHCAFHNVQSDSLDVGGPFGRSRKLLPGQEARTFQAAIGREGDRVPPMTRKYGIVRALTLPQAQVKALALFLNWYCPLRQIPLLACEDMRTFRIGGADEKDPVTKVRGVIAHAQVSDPGRRVDGFLELLQIKSQVSPSSSGAPAKTSSILRLNTTSSRVVLSRS